MSVTSLNAPAGHEPDGRLDVRAAAFASARDGLLVLDDDRRCVDSNLAASELLGVTLNGLDAPRLDEFGPAGLLSWIMGSWPSFLRDGRAVGEFETPARDGSRAVIEFTAQARIAPGRHLLVLRDVTERADAETGRYNLAVMLDGNDDAISLCSPDGVLLSWNRGAERLFGHTAQEVIGRPLATLVAPAGRAIRSEHWQRALRGEPVEPFQEDRISKGGRRVTLSVTLTAITDEAGAVTEVGDTARDITELKRARVVLAAAQARAAEASELNARFTAEMNHQLRTPLNSVIGISELLDTTALDEQQREYVRGLRVSGEALMSVIEAILDVPRLEAGALELSDGPYDPRTVIEEVCSVVALGSDDVDVLSLVDPALAAVLHGDEQRVRHVLTTLVGNAAKVARSGTVWVRADVDTGNGTPRMRVAVVEAPAGAGAGEDSHDVAHAGGGPPSGYAETDLGLVIAKQLITVMDGEIGVEHGPAGSTVWFTLPLRSHPADPMAPPQDELRDVPILVVAPSAAGRDALVGALEGWHARTAVAADADAALAALRDGARDGGPYAVALIDHCRRGAVELDGAALARAIRADRELDSVRTVVLVAPRAAHAVGAAVAADAIVTRPAGQRRLYAELTGALARPVNDAAGGPAGPREPKPRGSAGRVLVAEDSPVNQFVAVRVLEARGYLVDVANDGREAIAMHAHNVYDAIFMDCRMPEINGFEAAREIRRREGTKRRTPIIAMTTSTLASDRERCAAAGMDFHIGKPFRPSGLDDVLARAIASSAGSP